MSCCELVVRIRYGDLFFFTRRSNGTFLPRTKAMNWIVSKSDQFGYQGLTRRGEHNWRVCLALNGAT